MMLVFCDFDHTLVEENSDTEVVRVLGGEELLLEELRELSRSEAYSGRWTELMVAASLSSVCARSKSD